MPAPQEPAVDVTWPPLNTITVPDPEEPPPMPAAFESAQRELFHGSTCEVIVPPLKMSVPAFSLAAEPMPAEWPPPVTFSTQPSASILTRESPAFTWVVPS